MAAKHKPNELYIERVFDAPRSMVWQAWVDPDQVAKWWGPRGFTLTTDYKDVRTGGSWRYTMHGPDGVDYPNHTKFLEVDEYARLVYDHGGFEDRPPLFRVTVNFSDLGGKTKMEMTMALASEQAAKEAKQFIKKASGDSTWDRLAEYLSPTDRFFINRSFDAPIDLVFDMWADPHHLVKWLPPAGATMECVRADIRTGGTSLLRMNGSGGPAMHVRAAYEKVDKPNCIVYRQTFCDENERPTPPAFAEGWPAELMVSVTLTEEWPGRTRVTVQSEVAGEATAAERETFRQGKGGMTQGWTGSFDQLERLLSPA